MNAENPFPSRIVVAATTVILVAYDVFAAFHWGPNSTLSVQVTTLSHGYPIIPFAFGLLIGHLFAQNQ